MTDTKNLQPMPSEQRVFGFRDHASLWFSLGVGLLVMQVGAYLIPAMGTQAALATIVLGSILGAGFLAYVAQLGADRGLSSAGLIQQTFGAGFAKLPIVLNVVQLLGWTAFELVVMRDGTAAMLAQATGIKAAWIPYAATLVFGVALYLLAAGSMVRLVRQLIGKYGLPLVVLSLLWLTIQFVLQAGSNPGGFAAFWNRPGNGSMSTIAAIDLVMAMPVSWLPLVADYARFGKESGGSQTALRGTWLGYAIANIWCYGLGVLVVSVAAPSADLVTTLLLAQFGLIALGLILIDELDNAYGDVHSGAVSLNHLSARRTVPTWGKVMAVAAIAAAMLLDMHGLEPFLLTLSAIFVPLFGVIAAWLCAGGRATESRINVPLAVIWLIGMAVSYFAPKLYPSIGQSIPALIVTLGLTTAYRKLAK
ncbi:MAG: cytosine permease [Cytophagales bacterium]|nr:cytosine permease [Cytophagales bacterium]